MKLVEDGEIRLEQTVASVMNEFDTSLRRPGTEWTYCTAGFILLGEIIGLVTGESFDRYVTDNFLELLKMTRSFFRVPEQLSDDVCLVETGNEQFREQPEPEYISFLNARGGIFSTLRVLWR